MKHQFFISSVIIFFHGLSFCSDLSSSSVSTSSEDDILLVNLNDQGTDAGAGAASQEISQIQIPRIRIPYLGSRQRTEGVTASNQDPLLVSPIRIQDLRRARLRKLSAENYTLRQEMQIMQEEHNLNVFTLEQQIEGLTFQVAVSDILLASAKKEIHKRNQTIDELQKKIVALCNRLNNASRRP